MSRNVFGALYWYIKTVMYELLITLDNQKDLTKLNNLCFEGQECDLFFRHYFKELLIYLIKVSQQKTDHNLANTSSLKALIIYSFYL